MQVTSIVEQLVQALHNVDNARNWAPSDCVHVKFIWHIEELLFQLIGEMMLDEYREPSPPMQKAIVNVVNQAASEVTA